MSHTGHGRPLSGRPRLDSPDAMVLEALTRHVTPERAPRPYSVLFAPDRMDDSTEAWVYLRVPECHPKHLTVGFGPATAVLTQPNGE